MGRMHKIEPSGAENASDGYYMTLNGGKENWKNWIKGGGAHKLNFIVTTWCLRWGVIKSQYISTHPSISNSTSYKPNFSIPHWILFILLGSLGVEGPSGSLGRVSIKCALFGEFPTLLTWGIPRRLYSMKTYGFP